MQRRFSTNETKLIGLIKSQLHKYISTFDSNNFLLNRPLWWNYEICLLRHKKHCSACVAVL